MRSLISSGLWSAAGRVSLFDLARSFDAGPLFIDPRAVGKQVLRGLE